MKIEWAESRMPVLMKLRATHSKKQSLQGLKIAGCLHVTKETAVLVETFRAAGAEVAWSGCNPLSTQDDVAAALDANGIEIFAWRGLSPEEWEAGELNRLFREHGSTGGPGHVRAETIRHGSTASRTSRRGLSENQN